MTECRWFAKIQGPSSFFAVDDEDLNHKIDSNSNLILAGQKKLFIDSKRKENLNVFHRLIVCSILGRNSLSKSCNSYSARIRSIWSMRNSQEYQLMLSVCSNSVQNADSILALRFDMFSLFTKFNFEMILRFFKERES